ncbi:MAG: HlyD family efflux transporter periplasmic adaptor subunit [Lutispora sp.]|nr:HlyD family efflux transporter periplasmic adaptor subunit [Lutispora sp.]
MSTSNTTTIVKFNKRKLINGKTIFIFLFIAIAAFTGFYYVKSKASTKGEIIQQTAVARRGDLKVTMSGSGTLASSSTLTALSSVEGTISKIYFKDGSLVESGSLIMELDSGEAKLNVKKLENNMAQTKLSRDKILKSLNGSEIIAPISGEITDIKYKTGDNAGKDSTLLTITDKNKLKLLLPFNDAYKNELKLDQKATIYAFDSSLNEMSKLEGYISFISTAQNDMEGTQSYNVEFTMSNPGHLNDTMIASAQINLSGKTLKSIGSAKLSYSESIGVKTEIGGVVEGLDVILGQYINKGDILANITNDDLSIELETNSLNLEEMENQLEYANDKLSKYKIYSTISGTLSMEDIKIGDAVKSGQTVFKVSNYDKMEFQISIDELDIAKIQASQIVNITVDALPETSGKPLPGIVTEIAKEGTSSSGVTTYPVTVQLTESNNSLKVGMNVNGEIIVNEKKDALYIPIEAVQKRGGNSIVYVKSDEAPAEQQAAQGNATRSRARAQGQIDSYYAGAAAKEVKVGINNDEYIEILSGLRERDIVILPQASSGSNSANSQLRNIRNSGGMPGGGMPMVVPGGQGR